MVDAASFPKLREFLKIVPPFHLLPVTVLEDLARTLIIEYFPKGEIILSPTSPPNQFLYIIRTGGVKLLVPKKEDQTSDRVYDYRDEGEFFGLFSLLNNEPTHFKIVAEEDTICYLIKKESFKKLLDAHPDILFYFTMGPSKGFRQFYLGEVTSEPLYKKESEIEQVLFAARVKDVMRPHVVTCSPEERVTDAAERMTKRSLGSLIVLDALGGPIGIVTDGDLRSKILASGKLANVSVAEVMSQPVRSIRPDAFCFEAVLAMLTHKIKYLAVMDDSKMIGIISEHDLMVSQGSNPVAIIKGIQQAAHIDEAATVRRSIDRSMRIILEHGGMAKDLCELITTLNDHLTQKVITLSEEEIIREGNERPHVPYCWVALGSEGRREQTLRTDQDNAIIFADLPSDEEEKVRTYFLKLAEKVVSGLEKCGFPRCKGGIMAVNPRWCQPYRVWKDYFRNWILRFGHTDEEALQTFIFFDFRPLYGEYQFIKGIQECILENLAHRNTFLREMAETAVFHQTPLSFFKRLVVEKSGQHKNQLNLKRNGLTPLIDAVRTLSLDGGIFVTNTLDRILALVEKGILSRAEADDLNEAFNAIMLVRVRHHVELIDQGRIPDNYIDPAELSIIQRTMLKEAFKAIDRLQKLLKLRFDLKLINPYWE